MDIWRNGWIDTVDGWIDRLIDGWTDGWIDI